MGTYDGQEIFFFFSEFDQIVDSHQLRKKVI